MITKSRLLSSLVLLCLLGTGCNTFRPMPTHGGGKRFDEEQRVVSATIRHAMEKMDFTCMRKSKVALEVTSLPTSGGANGVYYEGLDQIYSYNLKPSLETKKNITRQDLEYFEKALATRLRFDGYQVVSPAEADLYLVVLVDVLGTNHRRFDFGIAYRDHLGASCEMTYYIIDAHTQEMISSARSVASFGDYRELNIRFTPLSFHSSKVVDFGETVIPLPVVTTHYFTGKRELASVDLLQGPREDLTAIDINQAGNVNKLQKTKKKKKGRKFRGKAPKYELPGESMENGPDGGLLPPIEGEDDKPMSKEAKREKTKELTKQIRHGLRKGDLDAAQKALDELKALNPKSKAVQKFQPQIDQARKAAGSTQVEKTPADAPEKPTKPAPEKPAKPAPETPAKPAPPAEPQKPSGAEPAGDKKKATPSDAPGAKDSVDGDFISPLMELLGVPCEFIPVRPPFIHAGVREGVGQDLFCITQK